MTTEKSSGSRPGLPRLFSLGKVAAQLDVSVKTVRRIIKRGELPVYRISGQDRISDLDLAAYLARQRGVSGLGS